MSATPIADALLSDRHSSALVTTSGSVDWLAFPRFDSPSVLGRLLGSAAGHWQVAPAAGFTTTRRYLDHTLVLETTFTTATGTLVLTDAMAMGPDNGGHRLGIGVPHLLVRKTSICCWSQAPLPTRTGLLSFKPSRWLSSRSDRSYFKVMCWVALDRAIALAERIDAGDKVDGWTSTRDEIWQTVVRDGWSDEANSFTQYVGSTALDASNLMMAIVGFLPADDPRMLATIDAVDERLTDDRGLVYRYRTEGGVDGLAGEEGTFLLCTFWLAQALARSGQVARAREVFERAAAFVNDVGLLAEEVDAATGELLGNLPQAFSHVGLVSAAWAISAAERRIGATG